MSGNRQYRIEIKEADAHTALGEMQSKAKMICRLLIQIWQKNGTIKEIMDYRRQMFCRIVKSWLGGYVKVVMNGRH